MADLADLKFCQELPKIELHAHLNGSLSDETLNKLLRRGPTNNSYASTIIGKGERRTMQEGFEMFRILHEIVVSPEIVVEVTKDVITDFALDQVKYLELRSTPRNVLSSGMTKRSYMEAVLTAIQRYREENEDRCRIDVRYLPSIDRSKSVEEAHETVKLAEEFSLSTNGNLVVGVDFSGNPHANDGADYIPPMMQARRANLHLAVHMAEVEGKKEETKKLLELLPDRIGHGTFISNEPGVRDVVLKKRIPLEVCVTSNIKTCTVPEDHTKHHFTWWRQEHQHPCIVGTDDKGIFATSLSNEYSIAAGALGLSRRETFNWSKEAIDHVFADVDTKSRLRQTWDDYWKSNLEVDT
ncbi:N6-Methyl-AMP deaminase-like [Clavelina lepadiformis]|uniref:N6-Methyl-AMP deaminase-like n=1 Tax=Clavelina lepadiformis TaxID=159417 RepID=UPI00404158E6